jgi:serine/threonine-protein kinase
MLFGRYRLVAPAGRGGTAEVWHAIDVRTGEDVAVKRLHPMVFGSEAGRERLLREFRALRSLAHPNIVRVRDLELTDDEGALILDYVAGESLRERLARGAGLDSGEAIGIASDVAAALGTAHARGIVHRDVTPGNILLGPDGRARLTDFGIAHQSTDATAMTTAGMLVGTLRYLAPEQLRGETATPASDLYSLGAVTYEMLSGRQAFAATTPVGLVEAQQAGPAPLVGVAPQVEAAVRRAMSTDPAHRHPSVEAFAGSLRGDDQTGAAPAVGAPAVRATTVGAAAAAAIPSATAESGRRRAVPLPGLVAVSFGALVLAALAFGAPGPARETDAVRASPAPTRVAPAPTAAPAQAGDDDDGGKDKEAGKGKAKGNGKSGDKGRDD